LGRAQTATSKEPENVPCASNVTLYVPVTLVAPTCVRVMLPLVAERSPNSRPHVDVVCEKRAFVAKSPGLMLSFCNGCRTQLLIAPASPKLPADHPPLGVGRIGSPPSVLVRHVGEFPPELEEDAGSAHDQAADVTFG
jgi:hypothetical protein